MKTGTNNRTEIVLVDLTGQEVKLMSRSPILVYRCFRSNVDSSSMSANRDCRHTNIGRVFVKWNVRPPKRVQKCSLPSRLRGGFMITTCVWPRSGQDDTAGKPLALQTRSYSAWTGILAAHGAVRYFPKRTSQALLGVPPVCHFLPLHMHISGWTCISLT